MKLVIPLLIFLSNFLSRKKLSYHFIGSNCLIYESRFDQNILDYCSYIRDEIQNALPHIHRKSIFFLRLSPSIFFRLLAPCFSIFVQIEHTLVKPGGRDSEGCESGVLPIAGTDPTQFYLVRLSHYQQLKRFDYIVDYSRVNLTNVASAPEFDDLRDKMLYISPSFNRLTGVSNDLKKRNFNTITNFGNPNEPRRKLFLEALRAQQIPIQNIQAWYEDVEELYCRTRILVNIRQTDHHDTLEELRVLPALRAGAIVISETAPYKELTRYSQFIIWGSLEELPGIIREVQNNYEATWSRIFGSTQFATRMRRIEKCNQLALKRWASEVNSKLESLR
jgi:hypothetical protein